ncbi:hypothetical protein GQ53DRAFT_758184 [Thozetella sp. PMI_491]|nr:hypothetical protein GQ53DRAFT_758184 [Thozetella sp. PMI_491]
MEETETAKALKGILKTATQSFPPPPARADPLTELSRDEIQGILKAQQDIFDNSMLLIEFPTGKPPEFTAGHPHPGDAKAFTEKIIHFSPDDYDGLVQERNAEHKCGYVLCGKKNRTYRKGEKVLVDKNKLSFTVMPGEELAKWCSDDCMRRTLYVKVQLREVLRATIDLLDESDLKSAPRTNAPGTSSQPASDSKAAAAAAAKKQQDLATLEQERSSLRRPDTAKTMTLTIREKRVDKAPTAPVSTDGNDHINIEGHATKAGAAQDDSATRETSE